MVEAGQMFLPPEAHWLGEFKSELLAFPSGRFDDQVDALSQLLDWVRDRLSYRPVPNAGPELMKENYSEEDEVDFDGDPWGAT